MDEWYAPTDIWNHWWKDQCIWVIVHLQELREGHYPTRDGGSGYTDLGIRQPVTAIRPKDAEEMSSEMDNRLCRCREDGAILKLYYILQETNEMISKQFGIPIEEVGYRVKTALKYIARRKQTRPYRRWYYGAYNYKKIEQ
jgi:hypothetical protein